MNCPNCGKPRSECNICAECEQHQCLHHEFVPAKIPAACQCDIMEWGEPTNIPPVCDHFDPEPDDDERCKNCEHDKACHAQT